MQTLAEQLKNRKPSPEELAIEKSEVKTYAFRNFEQQGACLRMNYGPNFKAEIDDGQLVKLPECVAKFIATRGVPQYKRVPDPISGIVKSVRLPGLRYRFGLTEVTPEELAKAKPSEPAPSQPTEDTDDETK